MIKSTQLYISNWIWLPLLRTFLELLFSNRLQIDLGASFAPWRDTFYLKWDRVEMWIVSAQKEHSGEYSCERSKIGEAGAKATIALCSLNKQVELNRWFWLNLIVIAALFYFGPCDRSVIYIPQNKFSQPILGGRCCCVFYY